MSNRDMPAGMVGGRLVFLKRLALDQSAHVLVRKLALLDISHLGRHALEPLIEFVDGIKNGCPVRRYAVDLLIEFNRKHDSNGLNENDRARIARTLEKYVATEGLALIPDKGDPAF